MTNVLFLTKTTKQQFNNLNKKKTMPQARTRLFFDTMDTKEDFYESVKNSSQTLMSLVTKNNCSI